MSLDTNDLARKLRSNPSLWGIAGDIQKLAQPSIRLTARPVGDGALLVGSSCLGGLPDLPVGATWPVWKGLPMSFVTQVRLEEAAPFSPPGLLPPSGLLSFFYDANQETYGADPDERGGWHVEYHAADSANWRMLQPPAELPVEARFKPCQVTFSSELTLPVSPAQVLPELNWSREQVRHYEDFLAGFPTREEHAALHHRMFGHPNQLQDEMPLQCALMFNGVKSVEDPRAVELAKHKADWLLLLQVDSDFNAGMKWATSGMLYYWIERQALASRQFDRTWLVLQAD